MAKTSESIGIIAILIFCILCFSCSVSASLFIINNRKALGLTRFFEKLKKSTGIDLTALDFGFGSEGGDSSKFTYRDEGKSKDQGTFVVNMKDEQFNDMKAKMIDAGYADAKWSVTLTDNGMGGKEDRSTYQNISVFDNMERGHFDSNWRNIDFEETDKDQNNIDGYKFKFENWDPRLRFEFESYWHSDKTSRDHTERLWTDPPAGSGTWNVGTIENMKNVKATDYENYDHDRFRVWLKWHDVPL